jgi:hypothetical protein
MDINCKRCDTRKPSSDFNKNAARSNGHDTYCRTCMRDLERRRQEDRKGEPVPEANQCAIKGCTDRRKGLGFCNRHLKRFRIHGNPLAGRAYKSNEKRPKRPAGLSLEESFRWFMPGDPPDGGQTWLWQGPVDGKGYGTIRFEGRNVLAHRLAYEMFVGPIPDGMIVRHKNDTPLDVNPSNLELGTLIDNVQDRVERGRSHWGPRKTSEKSQVRADAMKQRAARGVRHARARFSEADIVAIREAYAAGETQREISERYGTSQTAICLIVTRKTWKHVP